MFSQQRVIETVANLVAVLEERSVQSIDVWVRLDDITASVEGYQRYYQTAVSVYSMSGTTPRALANAVGGGIGLLMMGYATQTYFWYGYQRANPDVGTVSTSPGFEIVTAVIFLLGTLVAFTGFANAVTHVDSNE